MNNIHDRIAEVFWVAVKVAVAALVIALVLRIIPINIEHKGSVDSSVAVNGDLDVGGGLDITQIPYTEPNVVYEPVIIPGQVTGIFYNPPKSSAVIGGEIVHEGDTILGVRVVRINKENIEFEKNDNKWTQTIQQPPLAHWE